MNTMQCKCWLVVEKGLNRRSRIRVVRTTANKPSVGPRQIAIRVELDLPASLFTEPQIVAKIAISGEAAPAEVSAETVAGVESALLNAGFVVRVAQMEEGE